MKRWRCRSCHGVMCERINLTDCKIPPFRCMTYKSGTPEWREVKYKKVDGRAKSGGNDRILTDEEIDRLLADPPPSRRTRCK